MKNLELHARLAGLDRLRGNRSGTVVLGDLAIRIEGLDEDLARQLRERWGGFLRDRDARAPRMTVRVFRAGSGDWLEQLESREHYRLEALNDPPRRVVASYHFAICGDAEPGVWRVGVTDDPDERLDRILDNALRYLAARLVAGEGGFAMHAAGVARDGRGFLLAGPSGSGKTTAVGLIENATSLGDDFGFVLPLDGGWVTAAVPFDNKERIRHEPPGGWIPVAGIWRLHQARGTWVETPSGGLAVASLMACTAFPWTMPDLADRLLTSAGRFVGEGRFRHLHFAENHGIWTHLV